MGRSRLVIPLIVGLFLSLTMPVFGADVTKIGVVDLERILEASSAGKAAQTEMKNKGQQMEDDLKQRGKELEELKKKYEREALVMSREMRDEKEREMRIKVGDFKALEQKFKSEFNVLRQNLLARIHKEIFEIAGEIGKKEGYLLIIEKREAGVFYAPDSIDITDKMIQRFNQDFAKGKGSVNNKKK